MLGIRGNPLSRNHSGVHNSIPRENGGNSASMTNGESTLNGNHEGENVNGDRSNMAVKRDMQLPIRMPKWNGHKGFEQDTAMTYSQDQQVTVLQETVTSTSGKLIRELGNIGKEHIQFMSIEKFLEYIERQRLTAMPHRGCHWDRVLKWAEFFALQISGYSNAIENFVLSSQKAAKLMWTCCHSLIELGQDNASPLSKTFGVFYELGLSLSLILRYDNLLHANADVCREVGHAFNDLLTIVRDVSLYYHSMISSMSTGQTSLDFASMFGSRIETFLDRKENIVNAMWSFKLDDNASMHVKMLRKWLRPRDKSLRALHKQSILNPDHRSEYTCEWLQRHLLDFSRSQDDTLAIHGPAGCGKTYLYRWLVERLQRPIGKKTYDTFSYAIEADVPTETTPLAVAKHLSLQLLEKNVGDEDLFNALITAYHLPNAGNTAKLETALWDALRVGLEQSSKKNHIMVVIDGIDEVKGGEQAARTIINHLGLLASKDWIQVITLSRNSHLKPNKGKTHSFEIKPDHTHEDLRQMTHQALHRYAHFKNQGEHAQEAIVEQIIHTARGNFLWAFLTTILLKEETSHDAFMKAVKTAKESPQNLEATISKLVETVDLSQRENHILLSSMLVAERPLSAAEVKLILQVNVQKTRFIDTDMEIRENVTHSFGHMIMLHNGFFRFRHSAIRAYIMSLANGQKLRTLPMIQAEFTLRLLTYCKLTIAQSREPSFEVVERGYVNGLYATYALLEYVVRYWTMHFGVSSFQPKTGTLQLGNDFKIAFPNSIVLVLLEWYCWGNDTLSFSAHEFALKIRQTVFGEKHVCVIQDLIVCGSIQRNVSESTSASSFFYRAWHIAQTVLRKHHNVIVACATAFFSITESMSFTSRTEIVSHKEELLKYAINTYKHQYGKSHDLVIRYYKMLAQLYVDIHEEHHAEVIWRELREIIVERFGKGSEEETSISENLTVVLKKDERKTDVVEYEKGIFDVVAELEVWNIRRIELTLELALSYEARKEFSKAEECYIELWRLLIERCHHHRHHHGVDIHIRTIEVVLEYARFLIRCKRHEEASNVLICIWTEYEEYDFESEILFLRLKMVGELMRSTSLLTVALSVFRKCWGWFMSRGKVEYVKDCELLITTTVGEISLTTSTTTTTTTTTTVTTTETIIKEIFESTITRKEVTLETVTTCQSLISFYMKLEQWSQAIEITRRSLLVMWKFILTGRGIAALPQSFGSGAIEIAISLATCYHRADQFHDAEEVYLRIYRACWNSCHVEDERFLKVYTTVIRFYEEYRHWHSSIKIYQELLVAYREKLGAHHKLTIQTLYILGGLCAEHGHGNAYEYYEEIVAVLNGKGAICHVDAFDAMFIVCRHYYEAGHWHKLTHTCKTLWETWKGQHHGHQKVTAEFAAVLYLRYRYVLEHHDHCEYSSLIQLTVEYRNACIKAFGALTAITIKSSMELGQLYMRSEKYLHEAITIYEEILTTTKTTSSTTTVINTYIVTTIKERLISAYVRVCSHGSVSLTITERAIVVVRERFESLKITLGLAHAEVLALLQELVLLHFKLKKKESSVTMLRVLTETCVEIIKTEKRSKALHEAAKTIGGIYVSCGMVEQAHAMIAEMRLQIITGSTSRGKDDFKLESIGKVSYVFLVTFEQIIRGNASISYSELMADILTETTLYESYHRSVKSQADAGTVLLHAAKLQAFLVAHHRHSQRDILQNQAFDIFLRKWGQHIKGGREMKLLFFVDLMEELGKEVREVQIGHAASASSVNTVRRLLGEGKFQEAYEVAHCALDFTNHQRAYHQLQTIPYGFKLSALIAGRDPKQPLPPKLDAALRKNMLELSRKIIREVLQACKESKINFIRMKPRELNDLSGLLGQQENFAELEWLLDLLWSSRDVQKSWKPPIIISIGRLFVQSRFLNKKHEKAIRLAEDIVYNMRRVWGSLDPKTLQMEELLSALYTSMGHHREAMGVHENILRLIFEGDDGDERTHDTAEPMVVRKHIELLRQSHTRLHGWDKDKHVYIDLIHSLLDLPQYRGSSELKGAQLHVEHWNLKDSADNDLGKFTPPTSWEFAKEGELDQKGDVKDEGYGAGRKPGLGMKRVTSHWGISEVRRVLYGAIASSDHNEQQQSKQSYANGDLNGDLVTTKMAASANGHARENEEEAGYQTPEEL